MIRMRNAILLILVSVCLLSQTSCGILSHQANRAKHILQWPFRAELDSRLLDETPEIDREWVKPRWV